MRCKGDNMSHICLLFDCFWGNILGNLKKIFKNHGNFFLYTLISSALIFFQNMSLKKH
jgi:hypothetical protein